MAKRKDLHPELEHRIRGIAERIDMVWKGERVSSRGAFNELTGWNYNQYHGVEAAEVGLPAIIALLSVYPNVNPLWLLFGNEYGGRTYEMYNPGDMAQQKRVNNNLVSKLAQDVNAVQAALTRLIMDIGQLNPGFDELHKDNIPPQEYDVQDTRPAADDLGESNSKKPRI